MNDIVYSTSLGGVDWAALEAALVAEELGFRPQQGSMSRVVGGWLGR